MNQVKKHAGDTATDVKVTTKDIEHKFNDFMEVQFTQFDDLKSLNSYVIDKLLRSILHEVNSHDTYKKLYLNKHHNNYVPRPYVRDSVKHDLQPKHHIRHPVQDRLTTFQNHINSLSLPTRPQELDDHFLDTF